MGQQPVWFIAGASAGLAKLLPKMHPLKDMGERGPIRLQLGEYAVKAIRSHLEALLEDLRR